MVAVDLPNNTEQVDLTEEKTTKLQDIMRLFSSHHRYTPDRFKWLWFWLNEENEEIDTASYKDRLQFITSVWKEYTVFRPFDTVQLSEEYLKNHPEYGFIIRLSTSQPGKITYTRMSSQISNKVIHTRLTIQRNGRIHTSLGTFDDIHSLVNQLSNLRSQGSQNSQVAEYYTL